MPTVSDDRHVGEMRAAETDETHGAYSFYDALPSPRWRLIIVIAVLGLAGLGVVSAFAYRAVFEGALLPTLPPLMAAENGPKKIVLNYGDARPSNSSQTSMVSAGSSEKFVSRWPADNQEPPKTAPISPNPSAPRPGVPIAPAAAAPPPAVAPPALTAPSVPRGTSSGTGTAFLGTEEDPHGHHPLRRVRANRYLGRGCRPQRDERQGTRAKAQYRSGALEVLD